MQTIGERLEEARKKKGISIREAAEATKIRGDYLQKFESNQFDIGLTEIYSRGFLRNYATYLKLSPDRILNDYAALGRGEVRPRPPNREIYGRLEVSAAAASEPGDRIPAPSAEATASEPPPAHVPPRYPRTGGSSLPSGLDPAVVFKYVKWAAIALGVIIGILILKSCFGGGPTPSPNTRTSGNVMSQAPTDLSFTLVALDTVAVRVNRLVGTSNKGAEVFGGTMRKGERQKIPWTDNFIVSANAGEKLIFEYKGQNFPMSWSSGPGEGHMLIPAGH